MQKNKIRALKEYIKDFELKETVIDGSPCLLLDVNNDNIKDIEIDGCKDLNRKYKFQIYPWYQKGGFGRYEVETMEQVRRKILDILGIKY